MHGEGTDQRHPTSAHDGHAILTVSPSRPMAYHPACHIACSYSCLARSCMPSGHKKVDIRTRLVVPSSSTASLIAGLGLASYLLLPLWQCHHVPPSMRRA